MWGRQQLSHPVLRPTNGPNVRPQEINTLREGNSKNSIELNANYGNYDQSRARLAFQDPNDKAKGYRQKALSFLHRGIINNNSITLELVTN